MRRADDQQDPLTSEPTDEFVSLARKYFAGDFPNPERKDCPPRAELEASIQSDKLPDDSLRRHLFGCSQCFSLYQQLLATRRELESPVPFWRHLAEFIFERRVLILGTASVVLVAVVSGVLYINLKTSPNKVTSVDQAKVVLNANVTPPVTRSSGPSATQNETAPEPVTVAEVDLRDYTLRRGNESAAEEPLRVKRGVIAFAITLPEGSPAGAYSVSFLDPFGKTLRSRSASSPDGKQLSTTLNLDFPENQKFRICVSRANEPPNCYPIVITKGT